MLAQQLAVVCTRGICLVLYPLPISALRGIGRVVGMLAARLNGRAARTTQTNFDLVYPHEDAVWRRRLAERSLEQTAMTAVEAVALWTWPLQRLGTLLRDVDGERLLRDRPAGRGALILVPHFGNWEFLGYYLGTLGPLAPLYERPKSAAADAILRAARERLGHAPAADSAGGLRHLVRWLRRGGVVAVLPDQVPTLGAGVAAPFFGHEAFTMTLVGKLLKRLDVDVLVGMAMRVEGGFNVRLERMDPAIRDADPRRSAAAMNAAVEKVVARDPSQYQWEYKRFRFPRQPNIYS